MKLRRLIAYIIDITLVSFIACAVASIKVLNPYYDNYIDSYDAFNETLSNISEDNIEEILTSDRLINQFQDCLKYSTYQTGISLACYLLYFVGFQKWNKNQTVGKKLMRLKVVSTSSKESVSIWQYLVRTIIAYNIFTTVLSMPISLYLKGKPFLITIVTINIIGYIITYIDYLVVLIRKDSRALHDLLGSTKVTEE